MAAQTKVTGVILAGGLARRMNGRDKGLIPFRGKPMVSYAIDAMRSVADQTLINANRHIAAYQQFGLPVVSDQTTSFDGPLAGILTGMIRAETGVLLVMPCDSPFFKAQQLQRLLDALNNRQVDVAVASDGKQLHPVFMAVATSLHIPLQSYLQQGGRKVETWVQTQKFSVVDFEDEPDIFSNINSSAELSLLDIDSERNL